MGFGLFNCCKQTNKSIEKKDRSINSLDIIDQEVIDDASDKTQHKYEKKLKSITDDSSIEFFNLENKTYLAKCVKCYDGDTVHLIFKYPDNETGKLWKWRCRINGIDTPEMKSSNPKEKELAEKARNCLKSLILDQVVMANVTGFDKYGRLLVDLNVNKDGKITNISEHLIHKGYAKRYSGGTKEEWSF
jgi:endonuclease YncB( thermonuclease family)